MNNSIYKSAVGQCKLMEKYNSILAKFAFPHEQRTIKTSFGETFLLQSGKKGNPVLILLHGASSNLLTWLGEIPQLSRLFNVIAIDILGEPGKSDPTRLNYNNQDYALWLDEVFNQLSLEKVTIMGMSQGGWIAIKYAVYNPDRIHQLILLSPAGIYPTKSSFIGKAILYSLLGKTGAKALNRLVMGNIEIDKDALDFMNLAIEYTKPRFDKEYMFSESELRKLTMPVLLMGGENDVIRSNEAIANRLSVLLPEFEFLSLPDSGHVILSITEKARPFLKETRRGDQGILSG